MSMLLPLLLAGILQLAPPPPANAVPPPEVRTEKLTADEQKQLAESKAELADAQSKADAAQKAQEEHKSDATTKAASDAQMKLARAERELKGTEDGISLAHHANTECGCYVASKGRDYDRVEFKDDTIVIHHIHEPPTSLH